MQLVAIAGQICGTNQWLKCTKTCRPMIRNLTNQTVTNLLEELQWTQLLGLYVRSLFASPQKMHALQLCTCMQSCSLVFCIFCTAMRSSAPHGTCCVQVTVAEKCDALRFCVLHVFSSVLDGVHALFACRAWSLLS